MNFLYTLNDDCIHQILDLVSLADLCRCSRTSKRLQALCEIHFRRRYSKESFDEVEIEIDGNGKLKVYPMKDYVKCFNKFMKNVTIIGNNFEHNKEWNVSRTANFLQSKCDQKLHKIRLIGDLELVLLSKEIENILHDVKVVEFENRAERGQDDVTFLKCCSNLTKLILRFGLHDKNFDAIVQQKYQQLTHFFHVDCNTMNVNPENLKNFFQMHGNLCGVALTLDFEGKKKKFADDHVIQCIRTLDCVVNLEYLYLSIGMPCFDDIYCQLNILCERDTFKRLEIEFVRKIGTEMIKSHVNQLATWKQLTKIGLRYLRFSDTIPALRSLVHLKVIVLDRLWAEDWDEMWCDFDELIEIMDGTSDMNVPQVEKVIIKNIEGSRRIIAYVMMLVRHWTNLKRIILPPACKIKFNVLNLNQAREKLENACQLTIFTDNGRNATNLDHTLVKLKVVKFEADNESCSYQDWLVPSGQ